jgi:hypothetical protein
VDSAAVPSVGDEVSSVDEEVRSVVVVVDTAEKC